MNNQCNNTLFTCFSSNASIVEKEITIPSCEIFVTKEITLNCCPICNHRRRCQKTKSYSKHSKKDTTSSSTSNLNCTSTNQSTSSDEVQTNQAEREVTIEPCTPFLEETIPVEVADSKILQIKLNLMNVCPNKPLLIGVLLCNNDTPYALKTKKVCKIVPCCNCRRHSCCHSHTCCHSHSCCCCKDEHTSTCFEFLLANSCPQSNVTIKIITEYVC